MKSLMVLKLRYYLLYGTILALILLIVRLPTVEIQEFIEKKIETALPALSCAVDSLSYGFPLSLQLNNVTLAESKKAAFKIDTVRITPSFTNPFNRFTLTANLYGGTFSAVAELDRKIETVQIKKMAVTQVDADTLNRDIQFTPQQIKGRLDFTGSSTFTGAQKLNLTALQGQISLRNGSFKTITPVLTLTKIPFETMTMGISLKEERLLIEKGKLRGGQLSSSFSGILHIRKPGAPSELTLKGELTPQKTFLQEIPQAKIATKKLQKKFKKKSLSYIATGPLQDLSFSFQK